MAKRVATSELNHDNWDKEEESEEAGSFKTASEEALKGRVIKKAKRRNLTEDQKKNVFSGLSFMSSTPTAAADAFSFLKQNKESESKENNMPAAAGKPSFGFVFGGAKPKQDFAPKPFGGFEFGAKASEDTKKEETVTESKKDEKAEKDEKDEKSGKELREPEKEKAPDDLMAKFKPASGSWTCDICMISNKADVTKCVACETPKPGAATAAEEPKKEEKKEFSFGSSGGFKFGAATTATSEPAKTGGFSFGTSAKPTGSDLSASESAKSGSSSTEPKPAGDLSAMFKPAAGSWTCDICMISNKADVTKCMACETPKPGAAVIAENPKKEEKKEFSFGASGGFKFGGSTTTSEPAKVSGFSFGSSSSGDSAKTGGFSFGAVTESKPSTIGGFSFGTATTESKPTAAAAAPATGGFKFGGTAAATESVKPGGFTFGSTKTQEETSSDTVSTTPPVESESDSPVVDEKKSITAAAGAILLNKGGLFDAPKGPFGTPAGKQPSAKSPEEMSRSRAEYLGYIKALNIQVASCISKHVDKNPLIDLSPVFEDYKKHIAGIREKHGVQPKTQENSPVAAQAKTSPRKEETSTYDATVIAQEEKAAPVVEEDAFFSTKCKLFLLKEGKYEERGKGFIHLKKTKEDRTQVVVRSENVLGSILLNVIKTKDTRVEMVGENNVLLVCVPNPPIPGEPAGPASFLVRVKAEFCEDLLEHLETSKD